MFYQKGYDRDVHYTIVVNLPFIVRCQVGFIENFTVIMIPVYEAVVFYSIIIDLRRIVIQRNHVRKTTIF